MASWSRSCVTVVMPAIVGGRSVGTVLRRAARSCSRWLAAILAASLGARPAPPGGGPARTGRHGTSRRTPTSDACSRSGQRPGHRASLARPVSSGLPAIHTPRPLRPRRPGRPSGPRRRGRPRRTEDRRPRRPRSRRRRGTDRRDRLGTDVVGRVSLVQGGSAATTARWLARLGARSSLIAAVGRDGAGRALVKTLESAGDDAGRPRRRGADRADRGGRDARRGTQFRDRPWRGPSPRPRPTSRRTGSTTPTCSTCPVYSLLGSPLAESGRRAIELARAAGAVVSVDLASIGPLLAGGRRAARDLIADIAPDVLFATAAEAEALVAGRSVAELLEYASVAVVKRGPKGATVLARTDAEPFASRSRPRAWPRPTRPAPATRSMPVSWPHGSGHRRPLGRYRPRSIARPWPVTGPPAGSCRRRARSCHSADGLA